MYSCIIKAQGGGLMQSFFSVLKFSFIISMRTFPDIICQWQTNFFPFICKVYICFGNIYRYRVYLFIYFIMFLFLFISTVCNRLKSQSMDTLLINRLLTYVLTYFYALTYSSQYRIRSFLFQALDVPLIPICVAGIILQILTFHGSSIPGQLRPTILDLEVIAQQEKVTLVFKVL